MNEWWLIVILLAALTPALFFMVWPLRLSFAKSFFMGLFLSAFILLAYGQWGGWSQYAAHRQNQQKQNEIQAILNTINGPQELIERLKKRLDHNVQSAQGWYLLGRLYSTQGDWEKAKMAFATAHELKPDEEQFTINYAQSLWEVNGKRFDDKVRNLFAGVLAKHPRQPDSLAMLAMDAYMRHDYKTAIDFWQRLLKVAPPNSDDAKAIRKAIAQAQNKLNEGHELNDNL